MLVGQVKTVVVTLASMALSACTGLTGNLRGEEWLAKCPSGSRNVIDEFDIHSDLGIAQILPGPSAIIPEDGRGLEVRDGAIEVKAFLPGTAKAVIARLFGVIHTGSDGAVIHFDKMHVFNGSEPEGAPPAGRIVDICAFASVRGYTDDLIPKAVDPPPDLHPGFMFVTTSQFGVHFAH
jgi:hypothetical protein